MMRPPFSKLFMDFAQSISHRSTCARLQVGTVITSVDYRQVYAIGYNGGASGSFEQCTGETGNCGCIHSETNAIINCTTPREVGKIVFVTHNPCPMCARQFVNLGGIDRVYFLQEYRDLEGITILERAGVKVVKYGDT